MTTQEEPGCEIVRRLLLLADWVDNDENATPELLIFKDAAAEIERLRGRIERIGALAKAAGTLPEMVAAVSSP